MKTIPVVPLVLVWMIACHATAENPTPTIDVRATGEVVVPSDVVVLRLSVSTERGDVQKAKDDNDRITAQIFDLADSQGIPRPRLLTTALRFGFDGKGTSKGGKGGKKGDVSREGESDEPSIHMSRDLDVTFDNITQAVKFVGETIKWDSFRKTHELRLMPLRFDVADRKTSSLEARRRAVQNAKERATLLAEQTGLRLGDAVQIYDDVTERVSGSRITLPSLPDDPLGDPFTETRRSGTQQHLPPGVRLVALQKTHSGKVDLDQLPPAQVTITATVRIVYAAARP